MNILIINHYRRFKNWRWGRMYSLPYELAKRGHKVTLFVVADTEKKKVKQYQENGFTIVEFPDLLKGSLRSGWDLWCIYSRKKYLRSVEQKFDIIHLFETRPATIYPALNYRKKHHVPFVIDWNDWWGRGGLITENRPSWYAGTLGHIETFYEEAFRKYGSAHTVVSDALKNRLINMGIDKDTIHWIPNCADIDQFIPRDAVTARASLRLPLNVPVFCFTGYEVLSDLDLVLDSFKLVLKVLPNALLLLTGKVTEKTTAFVAENHLEKNILQLGYVSEDDLKNVIASSDICLMPFRNKISNLGRYPGKVAEYLSMGKPIISNDVGEVGKLLKNCKVGLLAEPYPEQFSNCMIGLISNKQLLDAFGMNAREYAMNNLNWTIQAKKLEAIYKNLVETKIL